LGDTADGGGYGTDAITEMVLQLGGALCGSAFRLQDPFAKKKLRDDGMDGGGLGGLGGMGGWEGWEGKNWLWGVEVGGREMHIPLSFGRRGRDVASAKALQLGGALCGVHGAHRTAGVSCI